MESITLVAFDVALRSMNGTIVIPGKGTRCFHSAGPVAHKTSSEFSRGELFPKLHVGRCPGLGMRKGFIHKNQTTGSSALEKF